MSKSLTKALEGVLTILLFLILSAVSACGGGEGGAPPTAEAFDSKETLGQALFFDKNLSQNRTQSCATCHNPDHAFIDDRVDESGAIPATSLGDDGESLGDRNTPTAAYASIAPDFHFGQKTRFNSQQPDYSGYLGGQFLDGREPDLKGQAGGPPVNPIEMGMPDKAAVVERLEENASYVKSFKALYGDEIFVDVDSAYAAMAESIAKFEKMEEFAPFDSRYDAFLRGEYFYDPLSKAALGKSLFFSQQFTNCATCHQLHINSHAEETFTSYEYHNIGVPVNRAVRAANGSDAAFVDEGLLAHPDINDIAERGKFKVPTLRNVAVTGPYMHNGVFRELATVVKFYDHYLIGSAFQLNPETGVAWESPEVDETVNLTELQDGRTLTEEEVEALVCFMQTLTDARYEHLIPDDGIDCGF